MRYTVVDLPLAQAQLANLWMQAANRQAVADAADRIGAALRDDPETKVRPLRKFYVREDPPLACLVDFDPGDCMVQIISWRRTT
jgi:hypothetical protein